MPTTEATIARLIDADYVLSIEHREQIWSCREARSEMLRDFERHFIREAAKRHIPVHCVAAYRYDLHIVHSQYGMRLGVDDWAVLGRIGHIAAGIVAPGSIGWNGDQRWYNAKALNCPF